MALSTTQVLLLEHLMYSHDSSFPYNTLDNYTGMTIGDYINSIDTSVLSSQTDCGSYTTGVEWASIVNAVKNDSTLMNMTIATTHVDNGPGGGNGFSAVFLDNASHEAVVAFKGTEGNLEWADNFSGATATSLPDGVSTQHQANALDWYQDAYRNCGLEDYSVTITGHSKGGNKAKYVALMDATVNRCVSFDGQGFSDQFCEKYADTIAERQHVIENHNVDNDYVNILLNDVGAQHFYEGQRIGDAGGGFLENHCPNAFLTFDENGNAVMAADTGRGNGLSDVDEFLNSMLRSMSGDQQSQAASMINEILNGAFNGREFDYYLDLLTGEYGDIAAYMVAFTVEYLERYPNLGDKLNGLLSYYGLDDFQSTASVLVGLVQWEHFDWLLSAAIGLAGWAPDWLWQKALDYLAEKYGIHLTIEELRKLLGTLSMVPDYQKQIADIPSGQDVKIQSVGTDFHICVDTIALESAIQTLGSCISQLDRLSEAVTACKIDRTLGFLVNISISAQARKIEKERSWMNQLKTIMESIQESYINTETGLTNV